MYRAGVSPSVAAFLGGSRGGMPALQIALRGEYRPDPHWTCDSCGIIRSCYGPDGFPYAWAMADKGLRLPPAWRRIDGKDLCKECRPQKVPNKPSAIK